MPDQIDVELLIIGAGPAGLSAARAFREHGGAGRVVMLSADPDAPYDRPPLSKDFLRGESGEGDLPMTEPGELSDLDIDQRPGTAVVLDPEHRTVQTESGQVYGYTTCILATGSVPVHLPVPGADDPRVHYLRTLDDARRLRESAGAAQTAIVVGSGFIGCEAAASLARRGLTVTLLTDEPGPQQARLGPDVSARIAAWLEQDGVHVVTSARITSIESGDAGSTVRLGADDEDDEGDEGDEPDAVHADLLLIAAGVRQLGDLAEAAGLQMQDGRVVTDARMRTSAPGVLAAGDVAFAHNCGAGRSLAVEHWGEALAMGEIGGAEAAGTEPGDGWGNAPGFWSQIGDHMLKYAAWGDGYERARLVEHQGGGFTVWYTDSDGVAVGVLTSDADDDYEQGQKLVETGARVPRSA